MTGNRTTELLRKLLDERGVKWRESVNVANCVFTIYESPIFGEIAAMDDGEYLYFRELNGISVTPEQAIAATFGDEKPKKCCSTCQYRYVTGQRPYPTFGYMCGFGDGKSLCGDNRSVLDHMCCEHWEKELK